MPECRPRTHNELVSSAMDKGSVAGRSRAGTEHEDSGAACRRGSKSLTGRVIARATPMAWALTL
jgi:hypothetical protein